MFQSQNENLKNCFWALCSQPKNRFFVVNTVFLFCFLDRKILSNFKIPNKVCKKVKKRLWAWCSQRKNSPFYFVTEKFKICYPRTCPFFKFRRRKSREYEIWKVRETMDNKLGIFGHTKRGVLWLLKYLEIRLDVSDIQSIKHAVYGIICSENCHNNIKH